jgi:predicted kinase
MKPRVILLIGPPLSGKDTYLRTGIYSNHQIISRDDILMSLHKNNNYSQAFLEVNPREVDKLLNDKINQCINDRKFVVINMTNLTKKSRHRHLSKFPSSEYEKIAIVFPKLDLEEYNNRNIIRKEKENKHIPISVIRNMLDNWETVTNDEGFDKIINL